MLRKLFSNIFQSTHAPSLPSPPEYPEPPPESYDVLLDTTTSTEASSLPTDLLLEIFLHLDEPTDVIRCAGVCKPWRRAIIGNAASLRPHPDDRLDPRLLLGVFHCCRYQARLRRTPGPFQPALPSTGAGRLGGYETARSMIPAAAAGGTGLYRELLWSADGFILLIARTVNRLCLFNPVTGGCTFLPAAAASRCSAYVLLTDCDDGDAEDASPAACTGSRLAVRILAVQKRERFTFGEEEQQGLSYQVWGHSDGVWGPVQHSHSDDHDSEVQVEQGGGLCVWMERRSTLVCGDTVYWLAGPGARFVTCTLALDVRTGRTWTTRLPQHYRFNSRNHYPDRSLPIILATSGDGRLSLLESLPGLRIQVWVMLDGDDDAQWTLQQTLAIDVSTHLLPPHWSDDRITTMLYKLLMTDMSLIAFCPRSGCVVGVCLGQELLIDIHSGSPPRARRIGKRRGHDCCPYEMDCYSTYVSKMKHF